MLRMETQPEAVLRDVANELEKHLPKAAPLVDFEGEAVELGETLRIWALRDLTAEDLAAEIEPTDDYHHQLYSGGRPCAFAVSEWVGDLAQPAAIVEIGTSPLVDEIEQAITWLDGHEESIIQTETVVRLLNVPRQHLHALWLHAPVDGADRFRTLHLPFPFRYLEERRLYPADEFFRLLGMEEPVEGLRR